MTERSDDAWDTLITYLPGALAVGCTALTSYAIAQLCWVLFSPSNAIAACLVAIMAMLVDLMRLRLPFLMAGAWRTRRHVILVLAVLFLVIISGQSFIAVALYLEGVLEVAHHTALANSFFIVGFSGFGLFITSVLRREGRA